MSGWADLYTETVNGVEPTRRLKPAPCGSGGMQSSDKMPSTRKDGRPRKRNRYTAPCYICGTVLAPGEGVIERDGDNWAAFCAYP